MKYHLIASLLLSIVLLGACSKTETGPSLKVDDPWLRASLFAAVDGQDQPEMAGAHQGAGNSAAYMTLINMGSEADRLVGVSSEEDLADSLELHRSQMQNGVMTMNPVEAVDVPAGGQAVLEPGGYHIMLIGLKRELTAGESVSLVLQFEKSGP